ATPYLRLFGATLGGCYLASEALAARIDGSTGGDPQRYVTLARFFAENVTVQAPSIEKSITEGADAITAADAVLLG
ncbi:MAG: acyl-CoA dehydrogenase C-terminal domain-containing protein, partial [Bradyrhizobium sp.]